MTHTSVTPLLLMALAQADRQDAVTLAPTGGAPGRTPRQDRPPTPSMNGQTGTGHSPHPAPAHHPHPARSPPRHEHRRTEPKGTTNNTLTTRASSPYPKPGQGARKKCRPHPYTNLIKARNLTGRSISDV